MLLEMFTQQGTHMKADEIKMAYDYLGFEKAMTRLQEEVEKREKHLA